MWKLAGPVPNLAQNMPSSGHCGHIYEKIQKNSPTCPPDSPAQVSRHHPPYECLPPAIQAQGGPISFDKDLVKECLRAPHVGTLACKYSRGLSFWLIGRTTLSPWLYRRMVEILASLERERARVLRES